MKIDRFEDINAWKLARKLANRVYEISRNTEFNTDFELRDQIRSAAGSAMHNVAEGFDSESSYEFIRFLRYAKRSCSEVQSELYLALDQQYLSDSEFREIYDLAGETRACTKGLIKYLINYAASKKRSRK